MILMPPAPQPVPESGEDETYTLRHREDTLVAEYRFLELLKLGVDSTDADDLAKLADVEHTMRGLIDHGCPVHVAVRIVR